MSKAEQLVRDVARLFVKYNLEDWQIILEMLRQGGPKHVEIATAIEQIAMQGPYKRRPDKRRPGSRSDIRAEVILSKTKGNRETVLRELLSKLESKRIAPKLSDIRDAYIRMGGKKELPARRNEAIYSLLAHMVQLPEDVLASSVQVLCERDRDLRNEYSRWFNIIHSKPE